MHFESCVIGFDIGVVFHVVMNMRWTALAFCVIQFPAARLRSINVSIHISRLSSPHTGSDVDTRRRAASDLVKALCKSNEAQVMALIGSYVQVLLGEYATNPEQKWKMKDSAIYLVTSVVAKGQTQKHGITQVSELVNINDFFATQILPEVRTYSRDCLTHICVDNELV